MPAASTDPLPSLLDTPAWRVRDSLLLALLGAAHLALLWYAAKLALADVLLLYEPRPFLRAGLVTLGLTCVVIAFARRHASAASWMLVILTAIGLCGMGPVLAVGAWLLSAWLSGRRVLRWLDVPEGSACVAILLGLCLWIGVISATAAMKVHFMPVYVAAVVMTLILTRRDLLALAPTWLATARAREPRPDIFALAWTALLTTVVILHLFIVAKPEAGYDANTMHLYIPLLTSEMHRFSFDVTRHAWAVFPLGADWMFTAAYMLGGEAAARLANLAFGALACMLLYRLLRRHATPALALATVTLLAATPVAFLETGSLFVENLWLAYLLATLTVTLDRFDRGSPAALAVLALLAAGAMQCKVLAAVWLVPLLLVAPIAWRRSLRAWSKPALATMAIAILIGAWPYANAWMRTGNPVFPYLNSVFGSANFDTAADFFNDLYRTPLRPWSLYEMIVHSEPFIEGHNGAAGFFWLLLLPGLVVALTRWRSLLPWALLALGGGFFAVVFAQQSYLRYVLPAFALLAVLGGWGLAALPQGRALSVVVLVTGVAVGTLQLRLMYTANWNHARLCASCGFDRAAREAYLVTFMPDRVIGETMNRLLPSTARVGFFMPNAPSPAGFLGYARQANWHDHAAFERIARAETTEDLMQVVRAYGLTHVVCREPPSEDDTAVIVAFCRERVIPLWRAHGRVVGTVDASTDH
ncbi:MAG: glycosyltransferase family 39 protein [Pseudomonadota bacterium]|nr:glycosyltransferase family 39 protein [Pseudomonadota bacterium]